jgi:hypothetical protein
MENAADPDVASGDEDRSLLDPESSEDEDELELAPSSPNRSRSSKIWEHGEERLINGHPHWCCSHCTFSHAV